MSAVFHSLGARLVLLLLPVFVPVVVLIALTHAQERAFLSDQMPVALWAQPAEHSSIGKVRRTASPSRLPIFPFPAPKGQGYKISAAATFLPSANRTL